MKRILVQLLLTLTISICTFGGLSFSLPETGTDGPTHSKTENIPLYGLFEIQIENKKQYKNPFADVALTAVFTSPSGGKVPFLGFFDGDGKGGQEGTVWKQRFMPDEVGKWSYKITFSDSSPGTAGEFECVKSGANPGPWRVDDVNPHWFKTAQGDHFLPVAMHANCLFTPIDWQDAITWCKHHGYNTLVTATVNNMVWGDGWPNVTPFVSKNEQEKTVDYNFLNIKMWDEWDEMIVTAGKNDIYVCPWDGFAGDCGGQYQGKYPPKELAFFPEKRGPFDSEWNKRLLRYWVARQGAYWNLAYWDLLATEMFKYKEEDEGIRYGEYMASITPFGRMITSQDCEQWQNVGPWPNRDFRWLSKMSFASSRKLNTIQTAPEDWRIAEWQKAKPNNALALYAYRGFPVFATEALWEGQPRAQKPLRIIWGLFAAAAHTMWADWSFEDPDNHLFGSLGKGWVPAKPLDMHVFEPEVLGADCVGHKQLKIAADAVKGLQYWKMIPHNEVVEGDEAYCLAELGEQYMVYMPEGGKVRLNLERANGTFQARWLDPRNGNWNEPSSVKSPGRPEFEASTRDDWVLFVTNQ